MKKLLTVMALAVGALTLAPTTAEAGYRYVKQREFRGYASCGSPIYHWVTRRVWVQERSHHHHHGSRYGNNYGGGSCNSGYRGGYYRGY